MTAEVVAIDLFCGVGGLTRGLQNSGISVKLGVDLDPACKYPLEANNDARFLEADVAALMPSDLFDVFGDAKITLLAGCAPCQPFSSYSRSTKRDEPHDDWGLLNSFRRLVLDTKPTLVTMENVPPLRKQKIFQDFVLSLESAGYFVDHALVNGVDIGLPQRRQRLVLVASQIGPINIPAASKPRKSVRDVIGDLSSLEAGDTDPEDPLHTSPTLSELNLARIRASKPGGTWRDWPAEIRAECHTRETGATYPSVYGRMEWDKPAPTMTTQCFGFGNGRFGHPAEDRAISLREAALLQSFPRDYAFIDDGQKVSFKMLGRLIGNAVPVTLGEYIGEVLLDHVKRYERGNHLGG